MSLHESIQTEMQRYIDAHEDCASISPEAIAASTYEKFSEAAVEPHVEYGCLEHFKGMARKVLAGRYVDATDENPAYEDQGELFSGHLQERYPVPRKPGEEPVYKLRSLLTPIERAWNVRRFRRTGKAFIAHGDALEAEGLMAGADAA